MKKFKEFIKENKLNEENKIDRLNGLRKAMEMFDGDIQVISIKRDPQVDDVYLLQLYFPDTKEYGLAIYNDFNKEFIEEPASYEDFDVTKDEMETKYGFEHIEEKLVVESSKSIFGLANMLKFANKNTEDFIKMYNIDPQIMEDLKKLSSSDVFSFNSLFKNDTFKISYVTSGRLESEIQRLFFDGDVMKEKLEKAKILKAFIQSMNEFYGDTSWAR